MAPRTVIPFLSDNNVPDSVGAILVNRGHDVQLVRNVMAANAKDPVVAEAAIQAGRVLISWDKDFNHQRFMAARFAGLSRIGMACPEPDGAARLEAVIDMVEYIFERAAGAPILVRIGANKLQFTC